jgi:hypothetical protein
VLDCSPRPEEETAHRANGQKQNGILSRGKKGWLMDDRKNGMKMREISLQAEMLYRHQSASLPVFTNFRLV